MSRSKTIQSRTSERREICLDTTVAVAYLRNDPRALVRFRRFERVVLPVAVVGELHVGELQRPDPRLLASLRRFLADCDIATTTRRTAREYARIQVELTRMGRRIPINDVWIAATAMDLGLPLAARDAHFDHVPGLSVERW